VPRRLAALLSLVLAGSALVPAVAHADEPCRCEHHKVFRVCGYRGHGTPVIRPLTAVHDVRCRTVRTVTRQPAVQTCGRPGAGAAVVTVKARRQRVTTFAVYREVDAADLDLRALDAESFDDLPEAPG
jgi:hypothetical protein